MQTIPIFEPVNNPVQALVSAIDPFALRPGQFVALNNARVGNGLISVRGGMTASLGTVLAASNYRGHWSGTFNGAAAIFVAVVDTALNPDKVKVIKSVDHGVTWTEITAGSGKYGDTRLSDLPAFFSVVPSPENGALRYLVIQNGTDSPRVFDGTDTSIHSAVTPPASVQATPVRFILPNFFKIKDSTDCDNGSHVGTGFTPTASGELDGANATLSGGVNTSDNVHRWTLTTSAVDDGDTGVAILFTAMTGGGINHQVIVGIDTSIANIWDYFKLEIGTVSGYLTVFDPTDAQYPKPKSVALDAEARTIWVFDVSASRGASFGIGSANLDRYRLTYKMPATGARITPAGTRTFDIFMFAMGEWCPGNTDFGISYQGPSFLESPGVEFLDYETPKVREVGGPSIIYGNTYLQRSPIIKFGVKIPYQECATADLAKGVSILNTYTRQRWNGDNELRRYTQTTIAAYDSVTDNRWEYSSTGTATPTAAPSTLFVTLSYTNVTYRIIMPEADHLPIPVGKGCLWANSRLLVGSTSAANQGIAGSARDHPFRFSILTDFDGGHFNPDGPFFASNVKGIPTAFVAMSASLQGSSLIYAFTPEAVYAFSGLNSDQLSQVGLVSNIGTISPYSVAAHANGTIFYLDASMQIVEMAGGQGRPITRNLVDDKLAAIPASRRAYVGGAVFNDRYYLPYTPSGGTTNTAALVWEMADRIFTTDTPPKALESLISYFDDTQNKYRLLAIGLDSADLKCYEYDLLTQAQDLGTTNITLTISPWELHLPSGDLITIEDISVICDDATGGAWTFTRTYKPHGNVGSSTITADITNAQVFRKDDAITPSDATLELNGTSCILSGAWSSRAGKNLYKLLVDVDDRGEGYDR